MFSLIKFTANWKVQQPILEDHQALVLSIPLISLLPNTLICFFQYGVFLFFCQDFLQHCNSLLRHGSLCLINLFFFTGRRLSSLSLPLDTFMSSESCLTDSSEDMKSAFNTSSYFCLASSSIVVELCSTFSRAFAFYRKKVAI